MSVLPAEYPRATQKPIPAGRYGGTLMNPLGVVFHVQVGNGSLQREFSNSAQVKSAHLWIPKVGKPEQYVPLNRIAYAQAAGNRTWVSVECEGFPTEPYTESQITEAAAFYLWCLDTFAWPLRVSDSPTVSGIGTHSMGGTAWGGHACPGNVRAAQRQTIIDRIGSIGMAITEDEFSRLFTGVSWLLGTVPESVWKAAVVQYENNPPVRQPDMRAVAEQNYLKAGDLQSRVARLEVALKAITDHFGIDVPEV